MSELEIPERAYEVAEAAIKVYVPNADALDVVSDAINAAASIIVATELRQIAASFTDTGVPRLVKDLLNRRANELDPPAVDR
jgi:hypothetical protein